MSNETTSLKKPIWKKVLYVILIIIPILILLEAGIGIIISVKGVSFLSYQRLLEQRGQITSLAINLLNLSLLEPGEMFYHLQSKSELTPLDIMVIAQHYPETIGIYRLEDDGAIINYLQHYPSFQIKDHIIETATMFLEEMNFIKTYWNPNWQFSRKFVTFDKQPLLYTYFKNDKNTFLIVTDLVKLKNRLPDIFERWQRRLIIFADYFLPFPEYGAQIKFFDQDGSNFFTLGTPQGTGWDDIWEGDFDYLPWKMTVQLFPEKDIFTESASGKDNIPWGFVIKLIIGIACIIILPWYARRQY